MIISQAAAFAADSSKIGVLDLRRCIQESNEGRRVSENLQKKAAALQGDLEKKQKELVDMQQEIEKTVDHDIVFTHQQVHDLPDREGQRSKVGQVAGRLPEFW